MLGGKNTFFRAEKGEACFLSVQKPGEKRRKKATVIVR